jgi:hypothetical protein
MRQFKCILVSIKHSKTRTVHNKREKKVILNYQAVWWVPPLRLSRTFSSLRQSSVSPKPACAPRHPRYASSPAAPYPARPVSAVLLSRPCLQIPSRLMRSVLLARPSPLLVVVRLLWYLHELGSARSSCFFKKKKSVAAVLMYRFFFASSRSACSLLYNFEF